jgi:hypothetical protein
MKNKASRQRFVKKKPGRTCCKTTPASACPIGNGMGYFLQRSAMIYDLA